jgi:hypothetical protein
MSAHVAMPCNVLKVPTRRASRAVFPEANAVSAGGTWLLSGGALHPSTYPSHYPEEFDFPTFGLG